MQIRVHALRLCDELFTRSKQFRQLLVSDLGQVLPLALGHKPETPLPPPAGAAAKLRKAALECLERWNSQYGAVYGQVGAYQCASSCFVCSLSLLVGELSDNVARSRSGSYTTT